MADGVDFEALRRDYESAMNDPARQDATTSKRPAADPDQACPHLDFSVNVDVGRITRSDDDPTVVAFMAEITVECSACGEPFRWTGLMAGMNYRNPMCSVDERTLLAPIRPASADPDFGMGLAGYAINYRPVPDGR